MLLRVLRPVSPKGPTHPKSQIKKRTYVSQPQLEGQDVWIPNTSALDAIRANTSGARKLSEVYQEQLAATTAARDTLLKDFPISGEATASIGVRNAMANFNAVLKHLGDESPLLDTSKMAPLPQNLEDVMEVHELNSLYQAYNEALSAFPHAEVDTQVNVDGLAEAFAPIVADLEVTNQNLQSLSTRADAQAATATQAVVDLMYAKADNYIMENPNFEAQMEEEIVQNRWDLLYKDEE